MDILKSKSDTKSYRIFQNSNGMRVILVSTEKLEGRTKGSASLCCATGSFADPAQLEGLAHFLEHMLFMGSDKYPQENHYDSFVTSHGGSCNAMTEGEYTCFEFDVSDTHFPEALDIFANCFICPLLDMQSADREIQAIENEFNLAKNDDDSRTQQLFCNAAKVGHVLGKFSWGNKNSLQIMPRSKGVNVHRALKYFHRRHYVPNNCTIAVVAPRSLDAIQQDVEAAFGGWVDVLNARPLESFASPAPSISAPNQQEKRKRPRVDGNVMEDICDTIIPLQDILNPLMCVYPMRDGAAAVLTRIAPIKNTHRVMISWILDPLAPDEYRHKSSHYISHLLGHEGPGSLLSALKKDSLASGVSAGISDGNFDDNAMFSVFTITVSLTVKGLANWITVVKGVYAYLYMLRSSEPEERIFRELQQVAQMKFDYLDEEEECNLAERLAIDMRSLRGRFNTDLIASQYLLWDWKPEEIKRILNKMTATAGKVDLLSSAYRAEDDEDDDDGDDDDDDDEEDSDSSAGEGEKSDDGSPDDDAVPSSDEIRALYEGPVTFLKLILPPPPSRTPRREQHFGTLYWEDKLPQQLLADWKNASHESGQSCLSSSLHLPLQNPYVPRPQGLHVIEAPTDHYTPSKVVEETRLTLWHMIDHRFPLPKVEIYTRLSAAVAFESTSSAVLHDLIANLLGDSLTETMYTAAMAELESSIFHNESSITINVSGFSDKAMSLSKEIVGQLFRPNIYITHENMERQLQLLERRYRNQCLKAASAATNARLEALTPTIFAVEEKLLALSELKTEGAPYSSLSDKLQAYSAKFFAAACVDGLIQGNIARSDAVAFGKFLHEHLQDRVDAALVSVVSSALPHLPVVRLPPNSFSLLAVAPTNKDEKNVCLEAYYQVQRYEIEALTKLELLEQLLIEPFFDSIRTKQQLGYSVSCGVRQTHEVLGFRFQVVSSTHTLSDLQTSVLGFIDEVFDLLNSMSHTAYCDHIQSLRSEKLRRFSSLQDAALFTWAQIEDRRLQFSGREEQADLLLSDDFIDKTSLVDFARSFLAVPGRRAIFVLSSAIEMPILMDRDGSFNCNEYHRVSDMRGKNNDYY